MLVIAHLLNCFNARPETTSAFKHLFSNLWLRAAVGLSGVLQVAVVYSPILNAAFGTTPLTANQWLVCFAIASTVLRHGELREFAGRAWRTFRIARV